LNSIVHADSWLPPKPSATYESAAQDARFVVTASARPEALLTCSGEMYAKITDGPTTNWTRVWNAPLQNCPVTAVVANGGWRAVTFDSWYSAGFGDEVIVFYDEKGTLLKKHSLESLLSEEELKKVPRSISSRWWRAKISLNDRFGLLRVDITQNPDKTNSPKPIAFDLMTGEVIAP